MFVLKPIVRKKTIAIVTPSRNPPYRKTEQSIINQLGLFEDFQFKYTIIEEKGGPQVFTKKVVSLLSQHSVDSLFTIGLRATQAAVLATSECRQYIPIIFGGVVTSALDSLINKPHSTNILGTSAQLRDYSEQVFTLQSLFLHISNSINNIVIPYTVDGLAENESDVEKAVKIAKQCNQKVHSIEIGDVENFERKVKPFASSSTLLLILRDRILIDNIERIVAFCNAHSMPICTSDLESMKYGVTLGIGDSETVIGREMAKKGFSVLVEGKAPLSIPITDTPWVNKLVINKTSPTYATLGVDESKSYFSNNDKVYMRDV